MPVPPGGGGLGGLTALSALGGGLSAAGQSAQQLAPLFLQYKLGPDIERYQAYMQHGVLFPSLDAMRAAEKSGNIPAPTGGGAEGGTPPAPQYQRIGDRISPMAPPTQPQDGMMRPPMPGMGMAGAGAGATPPLSGLAAIMAAQSQQAQQGNIRWDKDTGMPSAEIPGPREVGGAAVYPFFPPTQIPTMFGRGVGAEAIRAPSQERIGEHRDETTLAKDAADNATKLAIARERAAEAFQRISMLGHTASQAFASAFLRTPEFMLMSMSEDPMDKQYVQAFRDAALAQAQQVGGGGAGGPRQPRPGGAVAPNPGEAAKDFVGRARAAGMSDDAIRAAWASRTAVQ